jgi:uncharacterized protein YbjQ (UPF0145 family)
MSGADIWQVNIGGTVYSTDFESLKGWVKAGRVPPQAMVRRGDLAWVEARTVSGLESPSEGGYRDAGGAAPRRSVMTGLSGNEMFCLHQKGYRPGNVVVGNSVYSLGLVGSLGSSFQGLAGGEVTEVTNLIHEGRQQSYQRMVKEAEQQGGSGITGVTSELRHFHGNIEFLSVASCVHHEGETAEKLRFSSSGDGQSLYCLMDSGFQPRQFVFSNVAYSIGMAGGLLSGFKGMSRGEIKEMSDVFNATRHVALNRIQKEAASVGANAVLGIHTVVKPFQGVHEMMMTGTATFHPGLPPECSQYPITSDLTGQETWNMASMGYFPVRMVLATAVYSLGVVGGLMSALKSFSRGEVNELTTLIYEAREHALGMIAAEANSIGADDVIGIKTHIHDMGNFVEFMAIGTAVKRHPAAKTETPTLLAQAVMRDKDTWISEGQFYAVSDDLGGFHTDRSARVGEGSGCWRAGRCPCTPAGALPPAPPAGRCPCTPAGRCPCTPAKRKGACRPFSLGNLSSGLCAPCETICLATRSVEAPRLRGCVTAGAPVAAHVCTHDDTTAARGSVGSQRCTCAHK